MHCTVRLYYRHDLDLIALYKHPDFDFTRFMRLALIAYTRGDREFFISPPERKVLIPDEQLTNVAVHFRLTMEKEADVINMLHNIKKGHRNSVIKLIFRNFLKYIYITPFLYSTSTFTSDRTLVQNKPVQVVQSEQSHATEQYGNIPHMTQKNYDYNSHNVQERISMFDVNQHNKNSYDTPPLRPQNNNPVYPPPSNDASINSSIEHYSNIHYQNLNTQATNEQKKSELYDNKQFYSVQSPDSMQHNGIYDNESNTYYTEPQQHYTNNNHQDINNSVMDIQQNFHDDYINQTGKTSNIIPSSTQEDDDELFEMFGNMISESGGTI